MSPSLLPTPPPSPQNQHSSMRSSWLSPECARSPGQRAAPGKLLGYSSFIDTTFSFISTGLGWGLPVPCSQSGGLWESGGKDRNNIEFVPFNHLGKFSDFSLKEKEKRVEVFIISFIQRINSQGFLLQASLLPPRLDLPQKHRKGNWEPPKIAAPPGTCSNKEPG